MQITAKQCFIGPLDLPPKFLPVAFLQLFDHAFTCFFLIAALETAVMRVMQALNVGTFTGAEGCRQQ